MPTSVVLAEDSFIVVEIGPGALVGEAAILEEGVRTATLRTRTAARVGFSAPTRPGQGGGRPPRGDVALGGTHESATA